MGSMNYLSSLPIRIAVIPLVYLALAVVLLSLALIAVMVPVICLVGDIKSGKKIISKSPFRRF